jgi:hypothetical protein
MVNSKKENTRTAKSKQLVQTDPAITLSYDQTDQLQWIGFQELPLWCESRLFAEHPASPLPMG